MYGLRLTEEVTTNMANIIIKSEPSKDAVLFFVRHVTKGFKIAKESPFFCPYLPFGRISPALSNFIWHLNQFI